MHLKVKEPKYMKELHKIREDWSKMPKGKRETSIKKLAEEARARMKELRGKELRKVS